MSATGVTGQPASGGGSPGDTVVTEQGWGQASTAGALTTLSRSDHTHGTPTKPLRVVSQAPLTSGNLTAANGGTAPVTLTQLGSDLVIAAAVGDVLAVEIEALCDNGAVDAQFEAATRNAGNSANVNYWSSKGAASLGPGGIASWYVQGGRFDGPRAASRYTVQAGDVNAGNVRVRLFAFGAGGARTINANASYPFVWYLTNLGQ